MLYCNATQRQSTIDALAVIADTLQLHNPGLWPAWSTIGLKIWQNHIASSLGGNYVTTAAHSKDCLQS